MAVFDNSPGVALTPAQGAQYLSQAGFSGQDLLNVLAVGRPESDYRPGVHRTSTNNNAAASGDFGWLQINYIHLDGLRQAGIINNPSDLYDPATNARAAKWVHDRQGIGAWAAWKNVTAADRSAAQAAVNNMGGSMSNVQTTGGPAPATLPPDAKVIRTENGTHVLFHIGGSIWTYYGGAVNTAGHQVVQMSQAELIRDYGSHGLVHGGDADELADISAGYGTYANFLDTILNQMFTAGDPRRNDPEILVVLATKAGRPDMTAAEFENMLKATQYYQARTQGELEWNDLSEAERQTRRADMKSRVNQAWLQHVGREFTEEEQPSVDYWADLVASGKWGFGQLTDHIKTLAAQYEESPWSRQLREEQEAQRQRPIDIENTVNQLRQTLNRWGLQWDETTLRNYGLGLVNKTMSDDDVNGVIRQQAKILYPWKDESIETIVAAAPWIEVYNRTMERQGSLETPEIRRALTAMGHDPKNNDPWSFEQQLKLTPAWVNETKNGKDAMFSSVADLGQLVGTR